MRVFSVSDDFRLKATTTDGKATELVVPQVPFKVVDNFRALSDGVWESFIGLSPLFFQSKQSFMD